MNIHCIFPEAFSEIQISILSLRKVNGTAGVAEIFKSATFVSWVFHESLLGISSFARSSVSNLTTMQLGWCPSSRSERGAEFLCRAGSHHYNCLGWNGASSAWNVAGRKTARCQQRRQSLAETLDGAENKSVTKQERCREVLISSHFPAPVVICSVWLIYRLQSKSWDVNKIKFFDALAVFHSIWAEGELPPIMTKLALRHLIITQQTTQRVRCYFVKTSLPAPGTRQDTSFHPRVCSNNKNARLQRHQR